MTTEDNHTKLEQVLQLFLQPDYNVTSTYVELLLSRIVETINKDDQKIYSIVQTWLIKALDTWNESFKPCQSVAVFTIKLVGSISVNEAMFASLSQYDIHKKICLIFEFQSNSLSASLKMAFTVMFVNLLENQSGRQWIAQTGSWKEILRFAQLNHTMYVSKESQKFLSVLLVRECHNRKLCEELIFAITEPLVKATDTQAHIPPEKQFLFEQNSLLLTTLEMLLSIMEYATFYDLTNPIPSMFEELVSIENRVKVVFEVSISTSFMKTVHQLSKVLLFAKLRLSLKENDKIDDNSFEQFCLGLCYSSTLLLSKKYILDLVISQKLGIIYWKKLKKLKDSKIPKPYKFEHQAIALMILPLCVTMKPRYMKEHYLFEEFMDKLFKLTCTPVQRLAYSIRDVILKNDFPMEYICKSTIDHILEIIDIIDRESAVLAFQSMCHAMKNFVTTSNNENVQNQKSELPENNHQSARKLFKTLHFLDGDPINDKQLLLAALLNGLNVITEKYKLKWQECVETICLLSIAQDILNHPGVNPKICRLALKTCKLAIQNFMPPNLALLVDFDEHTREIGPTLFKRIHDTNWEVQDSVLEILTTIATLSEHKYPPYQEFLLDNNFLQVAIDLVKSESESYVRASAVTFIATAVRINTIWEKLLHNLDLLDLAIDIVYKENEAIVRREAVVLVKELYRHRKWSKEIIQRMSQAMTAAAVLDLHWEVKINALEFWRYFIRSHLTDQGMLDGYFPNVTFSKEDRKIVSLDEVEIKKRLNKALDELARQWCLGVLLVTLKDESDLEVSKTSADIIEELRLVLLKYKLNEPMPEVPLPKYSATIDTNYVKQPIPDPNNDVDMNDSSNIQGIIDAIVEASDANLLASIYRDCMNMDGSEGERTGEGMLTYIGKVRRPEFLGATLFFDLQGYIKQRSDWLQNYTESFESVMDDILVVSENKDINVMDCY